MTKREKDFVVEQAQLYSENYATLSLGALLNDLNGAWPNYEGNKGLIIKAIVKELREVYCIK